MAGPGVLAAWAEAYDAPLRDCLPRAAGDGFRGVALSGLREELDPHNFGRSARRHFARYVAGLGLDLVALAAEPRGPALTDPRSAEEQLARVRRVLELAGELRVGRTSVALGSVARNPELARELVRVLADAADRVGVQVAVRGDAGELNETAEVVASAASPLVGLALDAPDAAGTTPPASLLQAAQVAYLRDVDHLGAERSEVALGTGVVDVPHLLANLAQVEYAGPLVVRRGGRGLPVDALRRDREYVASLLRG